MEIKPEFKRILLAPEVSEAEAEAASKRMMAGMNHEVEQTFVGSLWAQTITPSAVPVPLTVEAIHKAWEEATKPPTLQYGPQLSKMLDEAVAAWVASGTPREDIEGAMLIIPWEVQAKQTLSTPHGPLEIHFTKYAEQTVLLPIIKLKWIEEPFKPRWEKGRLAWE